MGEASSWKTWLARVLMCRRRTTLSCLGRHGPARKKDHGQRRRFVAKDALSFNTMLTRVNLSRGRTTSSRLGRLGPAPKKGPWPAPPLCDEGGVELEDLVSQSADVQKEYNVKLSDDAQKVILGKYCIEAKFKAGIKVGGKVCIR